MAAERRKKHPTQLMHLYDVLSKGIMDVDIDVGMLSLVDALHKRGVLTYFSCQGEPNDSTTTEASRDLAYVMMRQDSLSMGVLAYLMSNYPVFENVEPTLWQIKFDHNPGYGGSRMSWFFPHNKIQEITEFLS